MESMMKNAMETMTENTKEFHIHSVYDHKALKVMSRCLRRTMRFKISLVMRIFGWTVVTLFTLFQILLALFGMFILDVDTFFCLFVILMPWRFCMKVLYKILIQMTTVLCCSRSSLSL